MKRGHLLQDPRQAAILAEAESVIIQAETRAEKQGLLLTDSNVRQILLLTLVDGEPVRHPRLSKKEQLLHDSAEALNTRFQELQTPGDLGPVRREDWLLTLRAMLDHVETESPRVPRARDYLERIRRGGR
jgi:hypothetical protein